MTNIKIEKINNHIVKFQAKGHSGFENEGKDVLCAGISSILQTAVLGIKKYVKVDGVYKTDSITGYLSFELTEKLSEKQRIEADSILETMLLGLKDLKEGYSNYINLEVIENVY